jgi:hypothetical protein
LVFVCIANYVNSTKQTSCLNLNSKLTLFETLITSFLTLLWIMFVILYQTCGILLSMKLNCFLFDVVLGTTYLSSVRSLKLLVIGEPILFGNICKIDWGDIVRNFTQ